MLTVNGTNLKTMTYNGQEVKNWIHNGVAVFNSKVNITLVEGSNRRVIQASIGETITPSANAVSGATFSGWSKSSNGARPSKSIVVTGEMTLYRVVKINDVSATSYSINSFTTLSLPLSASYYSSAYIELNGGNQAVIVNASWTSNGYWYVNSSQSIPTLQSSYVFRTERSQPCTIIVYGRSGLVM